VRRWDNVKNKVSDTATRAKEAVVGTASRAGDAGSSASSRVGEATPSGGQVKQQAKRGVGLAQENPLGLAVGAVALGFLAGLAVPGTRTENPAAGPGGRSGQGQGQGDRQGPGSRPVPKPPAAVGSR
jgi:hypothetical protein